MVNGKVDDALREAFPDSEICGRFIIHPGENDYQVHCSGRKVAIINQNKELYQYYNFDELYYNDILEKNIRRRSR